MSQPAKITSRSQWEESAPWIDRDDADIDAYISRLNEDPGFDLRAKLLHWREKGYVAFEQVVSHELIDALLYDIEYLKLHYRDFELYAEVRNVTQLIKEFSEEDLELIGVKFNSIQSLSRAATHVSLTREVAVFLRHIFQSPPAILQSLSFYRGSEQSIHIDYPYVRCQTQLAQMAASWIPLEDIHPNSGPLAYYEGSHRTDVTGFFDWGNGSILMEKDSVRNPVDFSVYLAQQMEKAGLKPQTFCPRKGDAFLWHGNLCHGGTKVLDETKTRKSYVTHYSSLEAYPPEHKFPRAKNGSGALVENGGYSFEYPWIKNPNRLPSWEAKSASKKRWIGSRRS